MRRMKSTPWYVLIGTTGLCVMLTVFGSAFTGWQTGSGPPQSALDALDAKLEQRIQSDTDHNQEFLTKMYVSLEALLKTPESAPSSLDIIFQNGNTPSLAVFALLNSNTLIQSRHRCCARR